MAAGPAQAAAAGAHDRAGKRPIDLHQGRARIADAFVEDHVLGRQQLAEFREQIVRIDLVGLALVGGELPGAIETGVALDGEPRDPRLRGLAECRRRLRFQLLDDLLEDARAAALHAQIAGEGPHRRGGLENVDVDVGPERARIGFDVAREPRHVDVDQKAHVGVGQMLVGRKSEEARAVVRDIVGHVRFEHADAGELGELRDQLGRTRIASGIAGDQNGALGRQQPVDQLRHQLGIGAAADGAAVLLGVEAANIVHAPGLRQRLPLHHQIDRPLRLALHDGVGAAQRLLHHDAGRQRPLPLEVGANEARLIERLLHEVHVGIARAHEFVAGGVRRLAGHQQHRQPAAEDIVHRRRGVRRAHVDMNKHALAASGDEGITCRHVGGGVFVRTGDDGGKRVAALPPVRDLLDDRRVIGAEIAKEIFDPELAQPLQKEIGGRIGRAIGLAPCSCFHGMSDRDRRGERLCHPFALCEAACRWLDGRGSAMRAAGPRGVTFAPAAAAGSPCRSWSSASASMKATSRGYSCAESRVLHEALDVGGERVGRRLAGLEHDERLDDLGAHRVGLADHGGERHRRMARSGNPRSRPARCGSPPR